MKKRMSDFSFTFSIQYIIFNVGPENIKSDKQELGYRWALSSHPKNLQTSFGIKLSILFTHSPFLLSY